ncbi:MAG: hypothetical protein OEV94_12040 [Deltaproteobacteria bacterium]|nr:hypothetical protein [Deltaproteobacteria bacterium]
MPSDPSVFNNLQPVDYGGSILRGLAGANNLLQIAEAGRNAQARKIIAQEGLGSSTILQHVAEKNPLMAQQIEPMVRNQQAEATSRQVKIHDLLGESHVRVRDKVAEARAQNPNLSPADEDKITNDAWQVERHVLGKVMPSMPAGLKGEPQGPLFAGGRGMYREDLPLTMNFNDLLQDMEINNRMRGQYGDFMNITQQGGATYSARGTPGQLLAQAGPGGQISKIGEKPVGVLVGPERLNAQAEMRKEFVSQTIGFRTIQQDYGDLRDALEKKDRVGALTALTKYAKMHNPGIGLGEGQYMSVQQAVQALPGPMANAYIRLMDGRDDTLTDSTRQMIAVGGHDMYMNALKTNEMTRDYFQRQGKKLGFGEDEITGSVPIRSEFTKPMDIKRSKENEIWNGDTSKLPRPKTPEEANQLPPGTRFLDPQGTLRVR